MSAEGEIGQKESIKISQFWEEQLKAMPYLSSKYKEIFKLIWLFFIQKNLERLYIYSRWDLNLFNVVEKGRRYQHWEPLLNIRNQSRKLHFHKPIKVNLHWCLHWLIKYSNSIQRAWVHTLLRLMEKGKKIHQWLTNE